MNAIPFNKVPPRFVVGGRALYQLTTSQHVQMRQGRKSGRRDLNPRPSPWQGDALPLSYFRRLAYGGYSVWQMNPFAICYAPYAIRHAGAEEQNRTADTAVFSRVLYQLSYLGVHDYYFTQSRHFVKCAC